MEIIRGTLDSISRPASTEHKSSRVSSVSLPHSDRICTTAPFALVVLTNDAADQSQSSSEETTNDTSAVHPGKDPYFADSMEEIEDSKLQLAIEEMQRLDEILSEKIIREKEIRCQTKELRAKLWHELLQNKHERHSESAHEAWNTKLFLALEEPTDADEDDFVPVFETQVPDSEHDRDSQCFEQRISCASSFLTDKSGPDSLTESFEVGSDSGKDHFPGNDCGSSKCKNKQRDFVKSNIEQVSGEGGQVVLTQAERERLAGLLREIDEEEEDSARGADGEETPWTVSVLSSHGYTPEPADLDQLNDIDSKISLLLPIDEFNSVQNSYANLSMCQEVLQLKVMLTQSNHTFLEKKHQHCSVLEQKLESIKGAGSRVGWKCDGDPEPAEKVLQDRKERRGQEKRLRQIQQQLEILGRSHHMTNESADLTEEQLLKLLHECELTESWSRHPEMTDAAP